MHELELSLRENYIVLVFQLNELYHVEDRVNFCASFHAVSPQKELTHKDRNALVSHGPGCFCVGRRGSMTVIMDGP